MLQAKVTQLERLQSRVADVLAEEIEVKQTNEEELRKMIQERAQALQAEIVTESE